MASPAKRKIPNRRCGARKESGWEIVVLGIDLPDLGGLDTLREIRRRRPELPVLVYSRHAEDPFAVWAIQAGAHGYLVKSGPPSDLIHAIRRVIAGKKYVTPGVAEALAKAVESEGEGALSRRESQVVHAIAQGQTVSAIAGQMSLSVKSVSTYRSRALKKLGLNTNADLTRYAIEKGLVD